MRQRTVAVRCPAFGISRRLDTIPIMKPEHSSSFLLEEQDLIEPQVIRVAGGQVVVFSRRCPGRESVNEDSAAVIGIDAGSGVLAVADGVGGMQSGNHASSLAVNSLHQRLSDLTQPELLRTGILDAIEEANSRICAMGANAATTLAVMEIQGDRVRPYHVGDSMILLCGQRGKLRWQTISHSPVGYAVEAGVIDEADAMSHPDRHYVSNLVGSPEMRIEMGPPMQMGRRDTLLLCSDGLSDNLSTDEIVATIRCGDLLTGVQRLVELATQRMQASPISADHPSKPDDLTIVAFRLDQHGHQKTPKASGRNGARSRKDVPTSPKGLSESHVLPAGGTLLSEPAAKDQQPADGLGSELTGESESTGETAVSA